MIGLRLRLTALLLILAGCSGADRGADPGRGAHEPTDAPARRFLSIGTAPPGGAFFVVGGALAQVLDASYAGELKVTTEATKGTQENIRRLEKGELDFALANSAITYFAVRGGDGWDQKFSSRAVMTLAANVGVFVIPATSAIQSIADLAGKRVVVGPAGAGFEYFLRPILQAHGVAYESLTALDATQSGAVDLLTDGVADAVFLGGAVPTASVTQAATSMAVRFIPYDEAAIDKLVVEYPFFARATIPAGTYRGIDTDYSGLDVGSMHLIAAAATPEELVYQATRRIYENRAKVVEIHPAGRSIRPEVVTRDTGTEFHPGAVRYYREIGIWPVEPPAPPTDK